MATETLTAQFAVISVEHPTSPDGAPCFVCLQMAETAAVHARVTGSQGATHGNGAHEATVRRALWIVEL